MGVCIMLIKWYTNHSDAKCLTKNLIYNTASNCSVYGVCNFDNPNLIVDSVNGNYISLDNVCYFVDSKTYANGKWIIHCTDDVLINNRNEILALNCLVVRSEKYSNAMIVDTNYPVQCRRQYKSNPVGQDVISQTETSYIIGVI